MLTLFFVVIAVTVALSVYLTAAIYAPVVYVIIIVICFNNNIVLIFAIVIIIAAFADFVVSVVTFAVDFSYPLAFVVIFVVDVDVRLMQLHWRTLQCTVFYANCAAAAAGVVVLIVFTIAISVAC